MLEYKNMTFDKVKNLKRDKTIFLLALSPLEAHGTHLPIGTDLIVSEKLLIKYEKILKDRYPDYKIIKMPSLPFGSSLPNYRRESLTHEMGGDESANQIENVPLL